ncbi:MFS transporter [Streptomyces neyagawaensis]
MRWWSLANFLSNAGTWMQLTVQNLLVLQITGSAAATGLSISVQAAPALLVSLVGGAAVDRWPRKTTAAVSQALLGAVAFTTAVLVATDRLDVTVLMVLAAVTGLVATVDGPACALLGNDLVRKEDVPSAIGVGSLVHSAGRLAGTALAGVTVGFLGTAAAYTANGLSFLFVASVIPFLRPVHEALPTSGTAAVTPTPTDAPVIPAQRGTRGARGTTKTRQTATARTTSTARTTVTAGSTAAAGGHGRSTDMTVHQGLVYFFRRPRLVALAGITGISSMFGRNYGLTLAVLVTGPLAGGAGAFGTVSTVLAVGGILGAVLGARLRSPSVRLVGVLAAGGALLQAVAGFSPSLAVLMVLVLPMAVLESVSDTAGTTVLQTDPPAHLRGRVLGVWGSISTGWGLAGPPLLGLLMELAGARGALVTGGLLIAATITAGFALRRRRATTALVPDAEEHGVPGFTAEPRTADDRTAAARPGLSTAA